MNILPIFKLLLRRAIIFEITHVSCILVWCDLHVARNVLCTAISRAVVINKRDFTKTLGTSYKTHACTALASVKFKSSCTIVAVHKPTGKVRICEDFKVTINPVLKSDIHPFPLSEELFHKLNQGCKFSNVADAYLQIELKDKSKELVAINTHQGLYRYKPLPFGLSCTPAVFQKIVEKVIQGISGTANYLDDIIVTDTTEKEHLTNLQLTLSKLKESGFRLQMDKRKFFQDTVEYLGHIIDTVHGKISEGGNFGKSLLMKQMARKILANLLAGLQLFHCIYIYNYW